MNDIYRVAADGGTPMLASEDRYVNEFAAAPSPDGRWLAMSARGIASSQWWRRGHSHIDESEIWLASMDATDGRAAYRRLVERGAKALWPMWAAERRALFYMSDRSGAENIWRVDVSDGAVAAPVQVTRFTGGRTLWPSISRDGRTIVFERDFAVWKLETATGSAAAVPIARRGAPASPGVEHLRLTNQIRELVLSPDGKKVAFVVRGEVFAASAKEGGDAARVTRTAAAESEIAWAPDSRRLVYVSDRGGEPNLFLYDFASASESRLTSVDAADRLPRFSPDGKTVAFYRNQQELRAIDLDGPRERLLAKGTFGDGLSAARPAWSPDGRWVAVQQIGSKMFQNVHLVAAAGGEPRQVSFLANVFSGDISWAPDGTFLLFDTRQRTESGQVVRVDLVLRTPRFREDLFRELFPQEIRPAQPETTPPAPAPKPDEAQTAKPPDRPKPPSAPVEVVFDDVRHRLSLVPVGLDVQDQAISPDGKWLVTIAGAAGQQNLYSYSLDELATERPVARQLTSTAGAKAAIQFTPDSTELFYLDAGRIMTLSLERREPRPVTVTAELDVDFAGERLEVFRQAWTLLRDNFYDPKFHGADWAAVRTAWAPRIAGAGSPEEMRRLLSLMIGELNASHLGATSPSGGGPVVGRLGLRFDRREYEQSGRLKVAEVIPLGPAALTRQIAPGDFLLAVDGQAIGPRTNLDELLQHKIDRRVVLVAASPGGPRREIALKPVNQTTEKGLLYRQWVEGNRAYVAKASGGRLGYVHMINMSAGALDQLHVDLDAENHRRDGVVIDLRNNSGGFVNVYAIDVFARRNYFDMSLRGLPAGPARSVLGQRALGAPTILVTNQHSLSDAEDFTEGYRTLGLGKVVGEPTAGWIIYTWNTALIDGTGFRLPRMRITGSDGKNMELNPRPVDVAVTRPIGETLTGKDSQLDAAVKELLAQLSRGTGTGARGASRAAGRR
jgi:Tol biopolymer transport system component/C-terminal processing protease CtpA/Prc